MRQAALALLLCGVLAPPVFGDLVELKDGRRFEGTVSESDGKVFIKLEFGTIGPFPAAEVKVIARGPTAAEVLEEQLEQIDRSDAQQVYSLGLWAKEKGLLRRSSELMQEVIDLEADHVGARKNLGQVWADGKWVTAAAAMQLAQGKLEAGRYDVLLGELLPALQEVLSDAKGQLQVEDLRAAVLLRSKRFAEAKACFDALAAKAPRPESVRYAAVAGILADHPAGVYVLTEPYPPTAMLLGDADPPVEAGPASLARPLVLEAALRDQARLAVKKGQALIDEAGKLEPTDPEAAKGRYSLAETHFDTADAIQPDFARSWRIKIVRRRIAMITQDMNLEAAKYDNLKARLGEKDLPPEEYGNLIVRMLRALQNVRADLDSILALALKYERELVLDITEANLGRQRVDALREVLRAELNGKR